MAHFDQLSHNKCAACAHSRNPSARQHATLPTLSGRYYSTRALIHHTVSQLSGRRVIEQAAGACGRGGDAHLPRLPLAARATAASAAGRCYPVARPAWESAALACWALPMHAQSLAHVHASQHADLCPQRAWHAPDCARHARCLAVCSCQVYTMAARRARCARHAGASVEAAAASSQDVLPAPCLHGALMAMPWRSSA